MSKSIFDAEELAKKSATLSGDNSKRLLAFGRFASLTYSEVLEKGRNGDGPACQFLCRTVQSLRPTNSRNRWTDFRDWLKLQGDLSFLFPTTNSSSNIVAPAFSSASNLTVTSFTPLPSPNIPTSPLLSPVLPASSNRLKRSHHQSDPGSFAPWSSSRGPSIESSGKPHGLSSSLTVNICEPQVQSAIIHTPTSSVEPKSSKSTSSIDFLISPSDSKPSCSSVNPLFIPPVPPAPPPSLSDSSDYVSADLLVELGFLRSSVFNCSPAQAKFISSELKAIGFLGKFKSPPSDPRTVAMWRYPSEPVMRHRQGHLPCLEDFYLHKIFLWFPIYFFSHLLAPDEFPCKDSSCTGYAVRRSENVHGIRLVTEPDGQYYIISSSLKCSKKSCKHNKSYWAAFNIEYLKLLPPLIRSVFPAHLTHRKAICKRVVDLLLSGSRSPSSLASDFEKAANSRYERLHLQYLELVKLARTQHAKLAKLGSVEPLPNVIPKFSSYDDHQGYCGANVSMSYVCELLKAVFVDQKPYLVALMKGVFGTVLCGDHTRKVAKKVQIKGGAVWSYALMNEDQKILSFVLTDSDSDTKLGTLFDSLRTRFELASVPLAEHI